MKCVIEYLYLYKRLYGFDDPTGDREGDGEPDIPLTVILTEDKYAVCIGVGVASYSAKYREAR